MKRLSFNHSGNSAEDLRFLENLTQLEELRLQWSSWDTPADNRFLQPLGTLPNLKKLSLKGAFNNQDLQLLADFTGLTELEINESRTYQGRPRIDDGVFAHLSGLTNLESLTIRGQEYSDSPTAITAEGIDQLSALPIKTLALYHLPIGDEIGDVLAKFSQLERLTLDQKISKSLLTTVAKQDSLKLLRVRTNEVVKYADIEQIKSDRPDLTVESYWSSDLTFNLISEPTPESTTPSSGEPVVDSTTTNPPTDPDTIDPETMNLSKPVSAEVLARLNDPQNKHEAEYLTLLGHADADTRKLAVEALFDCPLEDAENRNKVFSLANDTDSNVRTMVAGFIKYKYCSTPPALAATKTLLGDKEADIRIAAAAASSNFDETTDGITPILLKMVEEDEEDVASMALQQLQNRQVPAESADILKAAYPTHQYLALIALESAPRQDKMIPWLETLIKDEGQDAAGLLLGRWGAEAELLKIANGDDAEERLIAIAGLLEIRTLSPEVEAILRKGIVNQDAETRAAVLRKMYVRPGYSDELLKVVFHCMGDADEAVRSNAIRVVKTQLYERDAADVLKIANAAARKYPDNIGFKMARAMIGYDIGFDALTNRDQDLPKAHKILNFVAKDVREVLATGHELVNAERNFVGRLFYDAACASSLSHENEEAVAHLKDALENGWTSIGRLKEDSDLDGIREMPEYKALLEKYEGSN